MKNSDNEWKMSRVNKIKTYMMHYVVPVPFNLLFVPFDLLWIVWHATYTCLYNNFFAPIFESEDDDASVHSASSRGSPAFIAPSRTPTPGVAQPRPDSPVALAVASASPDASPLHHPSPLRKEGAAYAAANATSSSSPLHRPAPLRKSGTSSTMSPLGVRARVAQAPPSPPASPPAVLARSASPKTPKSPGSGSPKRRITLKQQAGGGAHLLHSPHSRTHVYPRTRLFTRVYLRAGGDEAGGGEEKEPRGGDAAQAVGAGAVRAIVDDDEVQYVEQTQAPNI